MRFSRWNVVVLLALAFSARGAATVGADQGAGSGIASPRL